ncbi:DUF4765 family protein [Streptomyces sp. C10-9-1]|uniref:DUF4765 family protein n=1 Tax=Streptomyces sp. C10-9-1 TaxID=1859285 RepID=UPI003F49D867
MKKRLLRASAIAAVVGSLAAGTTVATAQPAFAACGSCPSYDWETGRTTTLNQRDEERRRTNNTVYRDIKDGIGYLSLLAGPLPEFRPGVAVAPEVGGAEAGGSQFRTGESGTANSDGGSESGGELSGEPAGERPEQDTEGASAPGPATGSSPQSTAADGTGQPVELDRGVAYTVTSPATGATADLSLQFETLVADSTAGESTTGGPSRYSTGPTRLPEDDPNYDSDTDDFDEQYRKMLLQPTPQDEVAAKVARRSEETVTLWRGTRLDVAEAMARNGSASGDTPSVYTAAPETTAAQNQVAKGGILPEFTTRTGVAEGFSHNSALVVVDIKAKYLTKGSDTEAGWIANRTAPVTVRAIVDRTGGGTPGAGRNAS